MASIDELEAFAKTISSDPFGLAHHCSEEWAVQTMCFGNVMRKVEKNGGEIIYGWMFQLKQNAMGEYIVAIHHAVWLAPDRSLVDVTPFHSDPINHPLARDGSIFFLVDHKSIPIQKGHLWGPRPSKYYPVGESTELRQYVKQLATNEENEVKRIYGE